MMVLSGGFGMLSGRNTLIMSNLVAVMVLSLTSVWYSVSITEQFVDVFAYSHHHMYDHQHNRNNSAIEYRGTTNSYMNSSNVVTSNIMNTAMDSSMSSSIKTTTLWDAVIEYLKLSTVTSRRRNAYNQRHLLSGNINSKAPLPATILHNSDKNIDDPPNSVTGDPTAPTLALLYPAGLLGGYRNQAMRFVAFCKHAIDHNISQLLLPSLLWSTRYPQRPGNDYQTFWPVPFEVLFDVQHWNSYHQHHRQGQHGHITNETIHLPLLVSEIQGSDCWRTKTPDERVKIDIAFPSQAPHLSATTNTSLNSTHHHRFIPPFVSQVVQNHALLTPTANVTIDFLLGKIPKIRKFDARPLVQHCRHPMVHGGGKGAGVLWYDYIGMPKLDSTISSQKGRPNRPLTNSVDAQKNTQLVATLHSALVPAPRWRQLAQQCVRHYLGDVRGNSSDMMDETKKLVPAYVALHARVETEMMIHKCGSGMEQNLTTILNMMEDFVRTFNDHQLSTHHNYTQILQGTFVAVGREGMQVLTGQSDIDAIAKYNWNVLNGRSMSSSNETHSTTTTTKRHLHKATSSSSSSSSELPLFECGDGWVEKAYLMKEAGTTNSGPQGGNHDDPISEDKYDYGDIVPSMINFWLAEQATVFIGVGKSSWSTDVWTARYYQGKGKYNFQYTADHGIIPVPNNGLPEPHGTC